MATALEGFAEDAAREQRFFAQHGVAAYAQLLQDVVPLLEQDAALRERVAAAWRHRTFTASFERPALLCAALRHDAITLPGHPLAWWLADAPGARVPLPREVLADSLREGAPALTSLRTRAIQTNECARAVAWRLALTAAWPDERRVSLVDLGCSAGLNLVADRAGITWQDAGGAALELGSTERVVLRQGLDRQPLDIRNPLALSWLRACMWPGQTARLAHLDHAAAAAKDALARGALALHAVDAAEMPAWLERHARTNPRVAILAVQTMLREYLPEESRRSYDAGMHGFLRAHAGRALWVELEPAPAGAEGPVEIRAHLVRDGALRTLRLGVTEPHPRTVRGDAAGMRELRALTAP